MLLNSIVKILILRKHILPRVSLLVSLAFAQAWLYFTDTVMSFYRGA